MEVKALKIADKHKVAVKGTSTKSSAFLKRQKPSDNIAMSGIQKSNDGRNSWNQYSGTMLLSGIKIQVHSSCQDVKAQRIREIGSLRFRRCFIRKKTNRGNFSLLFGENESSHLPKISSYLFWSAHEKFEKYICSYFERSVRVEKRRSLARHLVDDNGCRNNEAVSKYAKFRMEQQWVCW